MAEWKIYRLGDIATMKYGKLPPKNNSGKYPIWSGYRNVGFTDTYNCSKGTTIVVARGVGGTGDVKIAKEDCFLTNLSIAVNLDVNICNPQFFYYKFLLSNLKYLDSGSAQSQITIDDLKRLQLSLPSLEEQRRIAGILGAIDDKIENNRRINTNLELQAQALFEEIFFSDNDWEYTTLGMLTEEVKTKVRGMDAKVLSPISSGELVLSEDYFTKQVYSQDISKYIVVEPMSFAYNPARINIGSIGINSFDFVGCVSPVYVVFKTKCEYENYLRLFVKSDVFKEEVKSRAIGGVRQTLSYQDFAMITTKYPPIESIRTFNTQYNKLLGIINYDNTENRSLATLRDTLLPKLMNGEIKV